MTVKAKLKSSVTDYERLLDWLPDIIFEVDDELNITYVNQVAFKITGYSAEDFNNGLNVAQMISPRDLDKAKNNIKQILSGEISGPMDYPLRKKDGSEYWARIHSRPIYRNRTIVGMRGVIHDITDRKLAEEKLKKSEELFRRTFNVQLDALFILDADNPPHIIDCNPAASKIFGYSKEEMIGRTTEFLNVDDKTLKDFQDQLSNAIDKEDYFYLPSFHMKRKDGTIFPTDHGVTPLKDDNGVRIGWVSSIRDITDRQKAESGLRESEAKYSKLVEQARDGIAIVQDGVYKFLNKAFLELTGYSKDELIEHDFFKIVVQESRNIITQRYKMRIAGEDIPSKYELKIQCKNESIKNIELNASKIEYQNQPAILAILRDITEQKTIERELKESVEKFKRIFEVIPDLYFLVSKDTSILEYRGKEDEFYVPPDSFKNRKMTEILPPDLTKKCLKLVQKTIEKEQSQILEYELSMKDGVRYYEARFLHFSEDRVAIFIRDITERKKAEFRLVESELKYRLITENANDLIAVLNENLKHEFINEATYERILGYDRADLLGRSPIDLIHPDELDLALKTFKEGFEKGEGSGEFRLKKRDGNYVWLEIRGKTFIDPNGKIKALLISRDISERKLAEQKLKESEEKYRLITENANDLIIVINEKFETEYINEQVHKKLLGYSDGETLGKNGLEFIHPNDVKLAIAATQKAFREGTGNVELRIKDKNGNYIWLDANGKIFTDDAGKKKLLIISRDISERKKFEEERKDYLLNLEKEVELKTNELMQKEKLATIGLLAAGVAHEINNPIMGIMNFAEIIKSALKNHQDISLDAKPFSFIDGIISESQRISRIINDLLIFARKDTEKPRDAAILDVINSTIGLLAPKLMYEKICLNLNFEEELPKMTLMTNKLRQVFLNLFQNSIDALDEKFGELDQKDLKKISVKLKKQTINDEEFVKITIRDNGTGIKKENLRRIFDPFFTTKKHTKEHGTGLGLSISYDIIKSHGGEIKIDSEWGEYTLVEILLPIKSKLGG